VDLTNRALRFRSFHREALSWLLSATWPTGVVLAVGSRQRLLLMGQLQARPKLLRSAVTTEAEALASVRLHQPQLLIITDWLESGNAWRYNCRLPGHPSPSSWSKSGSLWDLP
jgi:hypothetical protein